MADIKTSISHLCKHLNFLLDMHIKPEMFRLAKFNKSDENVVKIFWSILKNVIELPETTNIVNDVKHFFLTELKYEALQFYSLPVDMSYGSRELLLALGYIISLNYLDKFVKTSVANSPLNPDYQFKTDLNTQHKIQNYSFGLKQLKTEDDLEQALKWIEGRTDFNKKAIIEYHDCCNKMSSKLGKTTLLPNMDELSFSEILALNNTECAEAFLEQTETVWKILQNHERWLSSQVVFWNWMESVLMERIKAANRINLEEVEKLHLTLIK